MNKEEKHLIVEDDIIARKDMEKYNWMKNEYIRENKRMLKLIDKQKKKIEKLKKEATNG